MHGMDDGLNAHHRVGLALGSGSARGWAHIGVIRALAEAGIEIGCVAGTSIGSLVGAALVLNRMDALEAFARRFDWKQIVSFMDLTFPRSGLLDGKRITALLRGHVQAMTIEELPVPYCAIATDLTGGREIVLRAGDLVDAIRASISVPGILVPVKKNGSYLVDGGLVDPVPVSAARNMGADYVIGVDLNSDVMEKRNAMGVAPVDPTSDCLAEQPTFQEGGGVQKATSRLKELRSPVLSQVGLWQQWDPVPSVFAILTASILMMEAKITAANLTTNPPDLLIQPKLGHIRFLDFHRADEAIAEGYREAMVQLKKGRRTEGSFCPGQDVVP